MLTEVARTTISEVQHGHHGEFIQGLFHGVPALITVPCPLFASRAVFTADEQRTTLHIGSLPPKAARAAAIFMRSFRPRQLCGTLTLHSNIPMEIGAGSSTADAVAVMKVLAKLAGITLPAETLAGLCREVESASDPLMFTAGAVLFAQRHGQVVENFGSPLPPMKILGFNAGKPTKTETLRIPSYTVHQQHRFSQLLLAARQSLAARDAAALAAVATASADISQEYLPKDNYQAIKSIARKFHSLGIQVSHSGSLIGIIFDPRLPGLADYLSLTKWSLARLGIHKTWLFDVGKAE